MSVSSHLDRKVACHYNTVLWVLIHHSALHQNQSAYLLCVVLIFAFIQRNHQSFVMMWHWCVETHLTDGLPIETVMHKKLLLWCIAHSAYAPSQWGMALQCNAISHWLSAYPEWSLMVPLWWENILLQDLVLLVQLALNNMILYGQNLCCS